VDTAKARAQDVFSQGRQQSLFTTVPCGLRKRRLPKPPRSATSATAGAVRL